ncbi:MAG: hypothetical protein KDA89_13345 [Planctomycetaceae bacterium]|nr:hypothetical protein [Planctomycetaceae bacterium]
MVFSAFAHLQNPMRFYIDVARYELLPVAAIGPFARTVPWLLLFSGVLIFTRDGCRLGAAFGTGLFLSFLTAQVWVVFIGKEMSCGCFGGVTDETAGWTTAGRAAVFFALCVFLVKHYPPLTTMHAGKKD